jgi:hypothetical protein
MKQTRQPARRLAIERLEPRTLLAAAGLVDVGAQPTGNLTGKIVYAHAGHGYTADTGAGGVGGTGAWSFQRPLLLGMVEDLGNQDQMTFLVDYLFRAGATIAALRPIGDQPNEVVLDNDDVGVTFTGAWTDSVNATYFGSPGDVPYRFASTSATETAVARYTPNIPAAGFYPVYAWTHYGSDRAADQLYRVNHSGGSIEVKVNHRRVGDGLVYLGTYHFEAGASGSVEISNKSSEAGRVVVADMIRFGNGMGDIARGTTPQISGRSREDEAGLYWVEWHVSRSQGIPTSQYRNATQNDRDATVSLSPRYAEYMNREADGALSDRVFVSYHSNAAGGRGVLGLYNGNNDPDDATPNQFELARFLGQEVNDDLVAQNGQFEFNWFNAGTNVTLDRTDIEFGEINNTYIGNEFDATIVEVAYHDNATDAALMRDPKVRDAAGRATYQGIVKYFNSVDGAATSLTMLPGRVPQVRAEALDADSVKITWTAPAANSYNGDAPTGYRIYGSTNGYGFDGGTLVAGGGTTTFTLDGLSAAEGAYYFKVAAVNSGGEGAASEVVAATAASHQTRILIVNGFDRLTRQQNPLQPVPGGQAERVRPRQSNSFDYAVQAAAAVEGAAAHARVDAASNEMVASGAVSLANYDAVVWLAGEESTADDTFSAAEQAAVANYLAGGGKLFVSGAEIGWDLDAQGGGAAFYNDTLKADYVADDAGAYTAAGAPGSIFEGISLAFDNGALYYNVDFPDRIAGIGGSTIAMNYTAPGTGGAAIQYAHPISGSKVVNFGFPFETITTAANRAAVMDRVLRYFIPNADFDAGGRIDGADFLAWQRGFGTPSGAGPTAGDADGDRNVDADDLAIWRAQFGDAADAATASATSAGALALAASNPAMYTADRAAVERYTFSPSFLDALADGGAASSTPVRPEVDQGFDDQLSAARRPWGVTVAKPTTPPTAERSGLWKRFPSEQMQVTSATLEDLAAIDGALARLAALSRGRSSP